MLDQGESSEVDTQGEIGFALIQMKAETLNKIDTALRRLGEGTLRRLFRVRRGDCRGTSPGSSVRVRCKDCEHARETAERRERLMARRRGSLALFLDWR